MLAAACLLAGPAAAIELGPGSFWEFRRLEESTSFAQGSGGSSTFSGSFFSGPADKVEQSFNQNNCQLILGILICGGDMDINLSRREFWSPSLGPLELLYSFSSCGGGFCSGSTEDTDVGLVRSSLAGDVPGYSLETEPSQLSTPMPLPRQLPAFLGFAHPADAFDALNVGGTNRVHDAYAFTLKPSSRRRQSSTWSPTHSRSPARRRATSCVWPHSPPAADS